MSRSSSWIHIRWGKPKSTKFPPRKRYRKGSECLWFGQLWSTVHLSISFRIGAAEINDPFKFSLYSVTWSLASSWQAMCDKGSWAPLQLIRFEFGVQVPVNLYFVDEKGHAVKNEIWKNIVVEKVIVHLILQGICGNDIALPQDWATNLCFGAADVHEQREGDIILEFMLFKWLAMVVQNDGPTEVIEDKTSSKKISFKIRSSFKRKRLRICQ